MFYALFDIKNKQYVFPGFNSESKEKLVQLYFKYKARMKVTFSGKIYKTNEEIFDQIEKELQVYIYKSLNELQEIIEKDGFEIKKSSTNFISNKMIN